MKARQANTIGRLVEMKRRKAEVAGAAHAAAHSVTAEAAEHKADAERRWRAALDADEHIGRVADLEQRDVQLRLLRHVVDEAGRRLLRASAHEATAREAVTAARVELRRFERWLERRAETVASEERRVERVAEDEVAARARRVG